MTSPSNRRKWIVSAVVLVLLLCCAGAALFVFSSCSVNKYIVAAGLPTPDRAYQTGTIYGYDVYIWECYQNKRIVLWKTSAEMTSGPFTREETVCGGTTPIEAKLAEAQKRERDPRSFW